MEGATVGIVSVKKKKEEKEEERVDHLLTSLGGPNLTRNQKDWCAKALFNSCSECNEVMRTIPQEGRAIVVDVKSEVSVLVNCSHCLVRNASWIQSISKMDDEVFNRLGAPQTQRAADVLVRAIPRYEKNRFIVVVIPA